MMRCLLLYTLAAALLLAACDAAGPTATPTREFSAPTLAPTPTIPILTSDELYADPEVGLMDLTAAALPRDSVLPPVALNTPEPGGAAVVQVLLADGSFVAADLYERGTARLPGVLMMGPDRAAWGLLPLQLQSAGFTVMVVDVQTVTRLADVDTLLMALSEAGTVDPALMSVIGAGPGADLGLLVCAANRICDALVMLSPLARDTLLNVLPQYNPRPLLVAAAADDPEAQQAAVALAAAGVNVLRRETASGRGTSLLQIDPGLSDEIIDWLLAAMREAQ